MTEQEALQLATHRHYKGGLYRFICEAKHTESGEELVIREHLYPHPPSIKARPASLFYGKLDDGTERYAKIEKYYVKEHDPTIFDKGTTNNRFVIEKVEDIEKLEFIQHFLSQPTTLGLAPEQNGQLYFLTTKAELFYIGFVIQCNKLPGYGEWAALTNHRTLSRS